MKASELIGSLELIRDNASHLLKRYASSPTLTDVLSISGSENKMTVVDYDRYREVSKYLRHIPVNPSNSEVSSVILKSYVLERDELLDKGRGAVNSSYSQMLRFVASLVKSARNERDLSVSENRKNSSIRALAEQCVYILHGGRGTGKTFFLNYALTRCDALLDRRKVLWVRINLVYKHAFYEKDIVAWMHAQAAKIALRYYDSQSKYSSKRRFNIIDHLNSWVDRSPDLRRKERERLRVSIRSMKRVFCELGADEPISPKICDSEVCREIYRYLRSIGWSFIFVLDGFDRLDVLPEQASRFLAIKSEIEKILSMRSAFGATILVVSRTYTFDEMLSIDPFRAISIDNRFFVKKADFRKVLRSRLEAIKFVLFDSLPAYRRRYIRDLAPLVDNFLSDIFSDKELLRDVDESFDYNVRAKMQFVYLLFLSYVNKYTGKEYVVVEHLLRSGFRYPAVAYRYKSGNARLAITKTEELNQESRFLPLITRYPAISNANGEVRNSNASSGNNLIVGIRILQLLDASSALYAINVQEKLSVEEICNICEACFGSDRTIVGAFLNELESFEVLRIYRDGRLAFDSPAHRVAILPKGRYFLQRFVGDVAYLNMCSMRTYFDPQVFQDGRVSKGYLGAGGAELDDWVLLKMKNATFLFLVLSAIDALQRRSTKFRVYEGSERCQRVLDQMAAMGVHGYFDLMRTKFVSNIEYITNRARNPWASEDVFSRWDDEVRYFLAELRGGSATV